MHHVCLTSAVFTMSQSILVALTTPALIFHIWLGVQTALGSKFTSEGLIRYTTTICLIFPWVSYFIFMMANLSVGLTKPERLERALFYCIVDDSKLTEAIGIFGTVFMLAAIILEVWTIILLQRNRTRIRQLSRDGRGLDLSLVARVVIFGIYVFLGFGLNIVSIIDWTNPIPDLFFSTFGIAVFCVFGTQRDIWHVVKDASKHVTSCRSGPSHSSHHSGTHHHPRMSISGPSTRAHHSRHSSHYLENLPQETSRDSKRHSLTFIPESPTRSLSPSAPLPVSLHSFTRQTGSVINIQSTPEPAHIDHSTPETYISPTSDATAPSGGAWPHFPLHSDVDLRNVSQRSFIRSSSPSVYASDLRAADGEVLSPEHSYPPSSVDLRSWATASRYTESGSTLNVPPVVARGDSPVVWGPGGDHIQTGAEM
ncbi:hypothetical protein PHLGIDRAFT_212566 [Phlebiopsis gigantea 11061_1 CR5-6]|uniref:Uncharacterized protein n=1 Tax=Phlebiopsis gigantea (strain 11061_1 CR5-6) TaxID=745531 RepID=A0A0C3RTI8_PHLG1|nr:hypothetical protein PHLGIDRAFT_212566 [Phlebiopsis gigantea 11061_1 CR5-6]